MSLEKKSYPQGIKWTKQRKCIYDILEKTMEPISVVALYRLLLQSENDCTYAVSTVYRILTAFEEKEIVIRDVRSDDGSSVYELNRGGHTHYAVCLECHKRIPLRSCPFSHVHLHAEAEGFTVTGHRLELYGYCMACTSRA